MNSCSYSCVVGSKQACKRNKINTNDQKQVSGHKRVEISRREQGFRNKQVEPTKCMKTTRLFVKGKTMLSMLDRLDKELVTIVFMTKM
jgi:hypothetical protein